MSSEQESPFKAGFISIIGKPNVGKSTLLNELLGQKIAPVSRKPQTTRENIHGILTGKRHQLVFIDTPGIHQPKDALGQAMVQEAKSTFQGADVIYFMVDPVVGDEESERILLGLQSFKGAAFLVVNKIDKLEDKQHILPVVDHYQKLFSFKEFIPVSALKRIQMDVLLTVTKRYLPERPAYFPEDMLSDRPVRDIVKELIREKVVRYTSQEIPYVTAVRVESMEEKRADLTSIQATIFVDKESQKGILVGKGGEKIKQLGKAARLDLERFLGKRVYLELWVKVLPGWKNDPGRLRDFGYDI